MREVDLDARIRAPDGVVSRELGSETVLLNLDTGIYFGFNAVATDKWRAMLAADTLYDAGSAVLRDDLVNLANELIAKGLAQVTASVPPRT